MSDINYLSSSKEDNTSSLLIIMFVYSSDLTIKTLSLEMIDDLLKFKLVNILFIFICFSLN